MKKIITATLISLMATTTIYASGTDAGTTIKNSATLSYSAGGVNQDSITSNEDEFVVDKKIDFLVTHDDSDKHLPVAPKQTDAQRTFTLKNEGNEKQDFKIEVSNLTNNESYDNKQDNRDINTLKVSIDGGNTWQDASGSIIVNDLDPDSNITILVKGNIPELGDDPKVTDGDVINIQLKAIAYKDDGSGPEENTGDNNGNDRKTVKDTVLGEDDDAVTSSNKHDGEYIAWGGYIVHTPLLSVSKDSCVLEDPVNGQSANAKRIPGATILYIIDIHNSSTTTDASDVNITDTLQSDLDGTTVANLKYDDGQDSCSCSNGTAYSGGTAATDADSDDQKIEVDNLTVTKDKHNCVSFEVDIK